MPEFEDGYDLTRAKQLLSMLDGTHRQGEQPQPLDEIGVLSVVKHRLSYLWWISGNMQEGRWRTEGGDDAVAEFRERLQRAMIKLEQGNDISPQSLGLRVLARRLVAITDSQRLRISE